MINDIQYKKMANAIVAEVSCGCTLLDGVCKTASDHSMNPNEARRLLERTNVAAHLHQIEKMAAQDDRYVQFEVVHPDSVMERLYGQTPVSAGDVKVASAPYTSALSWHLLDDTQSDLAKITRHPEKTASVTEAPEEPHWEDLHRGRMEVEQLQEHMKYACLDADLRVNNALMNIFDQCKYAGTGITVDDMARFATEAAPENAPALLKRASELMPDLRIAAQAPELYPVSTEHHARWTKVSAEYNTLRDTVNALRKTG